MHHHWRERNRDYWGTRLFVLGIVFMCSSAITFLFAGVLAILMIMHAGFVMTVLGMQWALSTGKQ